jgi:hypothetical protein
VVNRFHFSKIPVEVIITDLMLLSGVKPNNAAAAT